MNNNEFEILQFIICARYVNKDTLEECENLTVLTAADMKTALDMFLKAEENNDDFVEVIYISLCE